MENLKVLEKNSDGNINKVGFGILHHVCKTMSEGLAVV